MSWSSAWPAVGSTNYATETAAAISEIRTVVDGKSPLAGPGPGQAVSMGVLTATSASIGNIDVSTGSLNPNTLNASIGIYGSGSALTSVVCYGQSHATKPNVVAINTADGSERLRVDAVGNLLVGVSTGTCHNIIKPAVDGAPILGIAPGGNTGVYIYGSGSAVGIGNAANALIKVGVTGTGGRSINTAGTINASGADYAEYELKSDVCGEILKGQIVGFDADGKLTDKWADAVSFGVKTTNPSYVGGDSWGNENIVGKRPTEPICQLPTYTGSNLADEPQAPVLDLPAQPVQQPEESPETFAFRTAVWQQRASDQQLAYDDAVEQFKANHALWIESKAHFDADQITYAAAVKSAEAVHEIAVAQYQADIAVFEAALETERQKVDRIAYSGKVPCNVIGAKVGDYIVVAQDGENITGIAVADPTFEQYRKSVGRVRRILGDGRPEIAVIVH